MKEKPEIVEKIAKTKARLVKRFLSPPSFPEANCFDVIEVKKNSMHFLTQKSENAERYAIVTNYLNLAANACAPNLLQGFYSICMEDAASNNDFTLDCTKMPDFYQMKGYSGLLAKADPFQLEDKKNRIIFAGASTGEIRALDNTRMQVCNWGVANTDFCDFWITQLVQLDLNESIDTYGVNILQFLKDFVSVKDQLAYKFILSVDGNVAAWDRLVWIMHSNSLALKLKPTRHIPDLWYYPLLVSGKHYVEVTLESLRETYQYYVANSDEIKKITTNAQTFIHDFLIPEIHIYYTINLLHFAEVVP